MTGRSNSARSRALLPLISAATWSAAMPGSRGWVAVCEPISIPAAATRATWSAVISGQTGPVPASHSLVAPIRSEMMNMVAVKSCRSSTGSASSSTLRYPSSNVSPASPRARPARIAAISVSMLTPRSPRSASHAICSANLAGATASLCGSSGTSAITWYIRTIGTCPSRSLLKSGTPPGRSCVVVIS
ncbi:MAG TPA: hypothetical protein VGM12_11710 [Trebonia sp.]